MQIAILGAGNVSTALCHNFSEAGHHVRVGVRDPFSNKAQELAALNLPNVEICGLMEACEHAQVVILAVPFPAVADAIEAAGDLSDKVILDATNPVQGLPEGYKSAAELVAKYSGSAQVVKAFNMTGAGNMRRSEYGEGAPAMFIAGDSQPAKEAAALLANICGFEVVDAGGLENAALLENMALLWINLAYKQGLGPNIAFRLMKR